MYILLEMTEGKKILRGNASIMQTSSSILIKKSIEKVGNQTLITSFFCLILTSLALVEQTLHYPAEKDNILKKAKL